MKSALNSRWLLLIHQIPPKPDYFRVKIWRQLQKVGAVAVKNSVYVLPKSDSTLEDFQWVLREITDGGGDASLCEAGFVEGLSDPQIESLFKAARDADYGTVAEEARELAKRVRSRRSDSTGDVEGAVTKLRNRLVEIAAIDYFDSLGRQTAEGLVSSLELAVHRTTRNESVKSASEYRAITWVTRKGIHVDRMASAWLIRRFIDERAKFKFVPARGYQPEKGEVRFDMFDAEFSHEGDRCTAEVLMNRFALKPSALRPIVEIVHNIDLKDAKFERPESPGIEALINGICTRSKSDEERLVRGSAIFEDLFEYFSRRSRRD